MFKTKFEDNEVNISMKKETVEQLNQSGISYVEVFRLIESFAQKLLVSGEDGQLSMENEETQAKIDIDIKWNKEAKTVQIDVVDVNLNNQGPRDMPKMPKDARIDLGQSGSQMAGQVPQEQK